MSHIAELARAEAEQAEQDEEQPAEPLPGTEEQPAEEPPAEPEPEPEAPPAPEPAGLAPIGEAEIKRAERAIATHRKKMADILGEGYVAHDCPLCSSLGFLPELPLAGMRFDVMPVEGGVEFVGTLPEPEPDYREAQDKGQCPECDGWGIVQSGSRNPNAKLVPCGLCSGNGWVIKARTESGAQFTADNGIGRPPPPEVAPEGLGLDHWGRPAGHEHWGVPPAMIHA